MPSTTRQAIDRLLPRCSVNAQGCWEWPGATAKGYGIIGSGGRQGRMVPTHRVTYEHFVAAIPTGLDLDHLCRNPLCCNPWHLDPVPRRTNVLRGVGPTANNARKTRCIKGHPFEGTNLKVDRRGFRVCRTCERARWA